MRDGICSWDLLVDGRRRHDIRITLILDPALALVCWVHYAPPISDSFRVSYRKLLRWNDELPFVKFAVATDERPILTAELAAALRAYGVSPFAVNIMDAVTIHSKNERIYLPAFVDGVARTTRIVREYALAP